LPRSKQRLPYHVWTTVLGKIPSLPKPSTASRRASSQPSAMTTSGASGVVSAGGNNTVTTAATGGGGQGARKRARDRYEDPEHNNYLLKQLHRKAP
jgi:hypothetical protein